jgi:hypothetical protein
MQALTRTFTHNDFEYGNNLERSCDVTFTFDGADFRVIHDTAPGGFGLYSNPITQHFDDGEMSDADFAGWVEMWAEEIAETGDADLIRAAIDKLAPNAKLVPDSVQYLTDCLADAADLRRAA